MLFQKNTNLKLFFLILLLLSNVYLVFFKRFLVSLGTNSISRLKISIILVFMQMDYKVQSITFISVIINLKWLNKFFGNIYKQFCSTYVQLLRLHSFIVLELLQPIKITDIINKSYLSLAFKDDRLKKFSNQIM